MKIVDLIKIIGLDKDEFIPFILLGPGQHLNNELTIYPTPKGICFYKEADVRMLSFNDENKLYDIKNLIEKDIKEVYNNGRELNRYLAVSELLISIDCFCGGKGDFDLKKARDYVSKINRKIIEALVFNEIADMKDLIHMIKKDKLYRELFFVVTEVCCNKSDRYRGYKQQENAYCFGNEKYHEDLDVVDITVYDDCVELLHREEGREHEQKLDLRRRYTLEQKIITALDCWRCFYWN